MSSQHPVILAIDSESRPNSALRKLDGLEMRSSFPVRFSITSSNSTQLHTANLTITEEVISNRQSTLSCYSKCWKSKCHAMVYPPIRAQDIIVLSVPINHSAKQFQRRYFMYVDRSSRTFRPLRLQHIRRNVSFMQFSSFSRLIHNSRARK